MKKILLLFVLALISVASKAEGFQIKVEGTVQQGAESTLSIKMKNAEPIMVVDAQFQLPEGITVKAEKSTCEIPAVGSQSGNVYHVVIATAEDKNIPASEDFVEIAVLTVDCASDLPLGYCSSINTDNANAIYDTAAEAPFDKNVEGEIIVQKEISIDVTDGEGNYLYASPTTVVSGTKYDVDAEQNASLIIGLMSSTSTTSSRVRNLSFDVVLPEGITVGTFEDVDEEDQPIQVPADPELIASLQGSGMGATVEVQDGNVAHIEVNGGSSSKYIKPSVDGQDCVALFYNVKSDMPAGIYDVKINNISMNLNGTNVSVGNTAFSVMVGQPDDLKDPIVYGHWNDESNAKVKEAIEKSIESGSLMSLDLACTDATAEQVAEISDLAEGAFIYSADNCQVTRKSGVGTICVPFALESNESVTYYTLSSATETTLTFEPANTIPAGVPALYVSESKVKLTNSGKMVFFNPEEGSKAEILTFTGTYETKTINEGYYIAGGKFWDAQQTQGVTIPAFRAYFEGNAAGIKSFNIALDETTGLRTITAELTNDPNEAIYDLSGRKLNRAAKGVNIVNGKKYLVK